MIVLWIFLAAACILLAGAWFLASFVMTGKRQSLEEAMAWQSEHYDTSFYDSLQRTDYTVAGCGNYILHVQLLENPVPTDRTVILSHGYTDNRFGSLKYAGMYLELGYNCILYDLRGHGENEKTFTTYGILEGQDLLRLVEDTHKRYPGLIQLGLHGESLGAASTITSLKYRPDVDFVVADCGFSDLENVLRGSCRKAHIPGFLVNLADIGARIRYHYSIHSMRPVDSLRGNTIPVLFIHGAEDDFILPENSRTMYNATEGIREIHFIEGAGHAESILVSPEEYKKTVKEFLRKTE